MTPVLRLPSFLLGGGCDVAAAESTDVLLELAPEEIEDVVPEIALDVVPLVTVDNAAVAEVPDALDWGAVTVVVAVSEPAAIADVDVAVDEPCVLLAVPVLCELEPLGDCDAPPAPAFAAMMKPGLGTCTNWKLC